MHTGSDSVTYVFICILVYTLWKVDVLLQSTLLLYALGGVWAMVAITCAHLQLLSLSWLVRICGCHQLLWLPSVVHICGCHQLLSLPSVVHICSCHQLLSLPSVVHMGWAYRRNVSSWLMPSLLIAVEARDELPVEKRLANGQAAGKDGWCFVVISLSNLLELDTMSLGWNSSENNQNFNSEQRSHSLTHSFIVFF